VLAVERNHKETLMPFRWMQIAEKENEIVKARADAAVDARTDPHALVALSIRQLQDDHDRLEHARAVMIGEYNTATDNLERDLEKQRELDARGNAAAQAGHAEAAQATLINSWPYVLCSPPGCLHSTSSRTPRRRRRQRSRRTASYSPPRWPRPSNSTPRSIKPRWSTWRSGPLHPGRA